MPKLNLPRLILFILVALLHLLVILFAAFHLNTEIKEAEPEAKVMKLVDLQEEAPPPPPRPRPPSPVQTTTEAIAETMIETDEPVDTVFAESLPSPQVEEIDYLPMHRISTPPVFQERDIRKGLVYPPIARRSNVEGLVYLELFVDAQGEVRRVTVLREEPAGRGFGAAAAAAFQGIRGNPALANGSPVACRYRYPVRFTLR